MSWVPKLLLATVVSVSALASCEQPRREERRPRVVEPSPELFVREDVTEPIRESLIEEGPPAPQPPPQHARRIARTPPKWLERAIAEAREVEKPEPAEPVTPSDVVPTTPTTPPRFVPPPPLPVKPIVPEQPTTPDRRMTNATNVALGVGALGVGMSVIAVGAGDGLESEKWLAASWLGVGVAAFGTAGVLYALDPNPQKGNIKLLAGPGVVGVRGSF